MNFWIILLIYILFLAVYWFFVWSIYWHVREYTMPDDKSRWFISSFFAIAIALSLISFGLLFSLPIKF